MVICIDDDIEDAEIIREALESQGVSCIWHQDGREIFRKLEYEASNVKFILLDIDMPSYDGFDVLADTRDSITWSQTPIIIFSGSVASRDVTRAFLGGATFYLQKPATYQKLSESVRFLLGVDWKKFNPTIETFLYQGSSSHT